MGRALAVVCVLATTIWAADGGAKPVKVVDFGKGKWQAAEWTPLRLPHQPQTAAFEQKPHALGTRSFTKEQTRQHLDNVLLMTDTGTTEGEIAVTFTIGPERGTAPGLLLFPKVKDGVMVESLCLFVADYTMAVWKATTDPATNKTKYEPVFRFARYSEPGPKHVVRCRYTKRRRSVALQIDDSDVVVIRGIDINTKAGIWGCHGTCDFYRFEVRGDGTLPWSGKKPEGK